MSLYRLTKGKYVLGQQCRKALWLDVHERQLRAPIDASQRSLMDQGIEVGELARTRFPGGMLITEPHLDPIRAVADTERALGVSPAIFEAAFLSEDTLVVVDILEREDDGWHLIEVKASTQVKDHYLDDVAIQKHILEQSGIEVSRASLMLVNTDCSYPDLSDFFALEDVTERLPETSSVQETLLEFLSILDRDSAPEILIGRHCKKPHECPFMAHCWEPYDEPTIFDVERLHYKTVDQLRADGIIRVSEIPDDYPMKDKYWPRIELLRDQQVRVDKAAIRESLDTLAHPIHFLGFETHNPAIPRFDGVHPFEHVPFQYSLHVLHENGELEHREYLHTDVSDPRGPLAERLAADLEPTGGIIVWSAGFERRALEQLAERFEEHADQFHDAIQRLWDQLDIFRKHYKHHAFGGSNSIKSVLPVLVPELGYTDLDIQDGAQAQSTWDKIVNREPNWQQEAEALREYCRVDTLAMVEIHRHLATLGCEATG